jgi:DNA-binding response OmpR family regulator
MRKERILIIDDEDDIRDILKIKLSRFYHVTEARDGQEGWDLAKSESQDLIITTSSCNYAYSEKRNTRHGRRN